jgi:3-oxoacyl-[acyl-carrier protein] reductase
VLAQELQSSDISVNELIPGPVATDMMTPANAQQLAGVGGSEWLKRPEDVVPLALFLAGQPKTGPTAQSFSLMRRDG